MKFKVIRKIINVLLKKKLDFKFNNNRVRLVSKYPELATIEDEVLNSKKLLYKEFSYYKANVSIGNSAASLEAASFLYSFLKKTSARRVIDLGSGFSSYVLRKYKDESLYDVEVWSVDSSSSWLNQTESYLKDKGLSVEHLYTWDEFEQNFSGKFDLIFLDVRPINRRVDWLEKLASSLSSKGALVIDDVHKEHMRIPMLIKFKKKLECIVNLKSLTLDKLNRYSCLITHLDN